MQAHYLPLLLAMIQCPAPSLTTTSGWLLAFNPDGTNTSAPWVATATPGHPISTGTFPGLATTILPAPTTVEWGRLIVTAPPHVEAVPGGLLVCFYRNVSVSGMV
jgi:hypothetical protein